MKKYIIGYRSDDSEELVEFESIQEAEYESCEYVVIEAQNLDQAKILYDDTFLKWQQSSNKD